MPDRRAHPAQHVARFWASDKSLTALLVLLVAFIFFIYPLDQLGYDVHLIGSATFTLILLSGVIAAARSAAMAAVTGAVALVAGVLHWAYFFATDGRWAGLETLGTGLACGLLAVIVLLQVFRNGPITAKRIQGAVAAYLLVALLFAAIYSGMAAYTPSAFAGSGDATTGAASLARFAYFSFATLTTVGYGDIVPVQPFARSLAMFEALIGQLFPAVLLARLVSMELVYRRQRGDDGGEPR